MTIISVNNANGLFCINQKDCVFREVTVSISEMDFGLLSVKSDIF